MGAQLRGSCFCLNYQMVSWCTRLKENQFWCSFPSQGGFAYKLEPPHAHLVSLPPTHPAGLTSALACATYHLLFWKRGPRISTLLPVKPELQHLVDTESASCNPAWTTRLTGQALHLLPLSLSTTEIPVCFVVKLPQMITPIFFNSELTNRCAV